jgi:cellulose 1,4-beta-cellobiosidase
LVTNLNVQKCANAQAAYLECVQYAITQLNLPNVSMYLDAGHAGWLGWSANIGPAAQLFGKLYKDAGSPAAVRGLATNVANYNAWTSSTCPSYTQGDANCNEKLYVNALAPLLQQQGFPAHFIMDTCKLFISSLECQCTDVHTSSKRCSTNCSTGMGRLV